MKKRKSILIGGETMNKPIMKKYFYGFIALAIIIFIPIKILAETTKWQTILETVCINKQVFIVPGDSSWGEWRELYIPPAGRGSQAIKNNVKYLYLNDSGLFCRTLENQKCKEMDVKLDTSGRKISPTVYRDLDKRWCEKVVN